MSIKVGPGLLLICLGVAGATGCSSASTSSSITPSVTVTSPAADATDVARNAAVSITFDTALDASSVINPNTNTSTGAVLLKSESGENTAGTVTYNPSTFTVTLIPAGFLSPNHTYTAFARDIRFSNGRTMSSVYSWSFTTGLVPDGVPGLVSVEPADGATGVSRDTEIEAVFDGGVSFFPTGQPTASNVIVLDMANDTVVTPRAVSYHEADLTLRFTPSSNLLPNTLYSVTLHDVRSASGLPLPDATWTFTTSSAAFPGVDLAVVSTFPTAGATGVARDTTITMTFNQGLDSASVINQNTNSPTGTVVVKRDSGSEVMGNITYNPLTFTITFVPLAYLMAGQTYVVTVLDLRSSDGLTLTTPYSWDFTSDTVPTPNVPLTVDATSPDNADTDVALNSLITVTFNKALEPSTVINPSTNTSTGAILIKNEAGANVTGTVTYNSSSFTVTFLPGAFLSPNQSYTVFVRDVLSLEGEALDPPYSFSFVTEDSGGVLPPVPLSVLSTSPAASATNVARDAPIVIEFNKSLDFSSIYNQNTNSSTGAILLKTASGLSVAGSFTYNSGTTSVTLLPSSNLLPNQSYTAFVRDVRSTDGATLPALFTWSFTTGTAPLNVPAVVSTSPADAATGVDRDTLIVATFDQTITGFAGANPTTTNIIVRNVITNVSVTAQLIRYFGTNFNLVFTPSTNLLPNTLYRIDLHDIYGLSGAPMPEFSWTFTTGPTPNTTPSVVSVSPSNGATGVSRNTAVQAVFNTGVLLLNTTNFVLRNQTTNTAVTADSVKFFPATLTGVFVPSTLLAANTVYTVLLKDNITSVDGVSLAETTWSFTTGTQPERLPALVSTTPASGATGVSRDTIIEAQYDATVSFIGSGTGVPAGENISVLNTVTNTTVAATSIDFYPADFRLVLTPSAYLPPSTLFTVRLHDIVSPTGIRLADTSWSFTTGTTPNTTPSIASRSPASGATGVARNATIQVIFNGPVTAVTAANFQVRNASTFTAQTADSLRYNATTYTATWFPSAFFAANTTFSVTLRDIASLDGIVLPETTWNFTTSGTPDNVVPTVTAAGLSARAACTSSVVLNWSPGLDDNTAQGSLTYEVFQATSSGAQVLTSPLATTAAGVTTHTVTGLSPDTTYFFTARASDAAGNKSATFTERSVTTPTVFQCASSISVAGGPYSIASADFNGDARLDLAVVCLTGNTVAILLGNGDGTFTAATPATIAVGTHPIAVVVGNFNNDANQDLAVANRDSGTVSILTGNGDGTFAAAINTSLTGPLALATGEFNNPAGANLDLAVATGDDVSILAGNGNGTFSATVTRLTVAATSNASSVAVADYSNDGRQDVAVTYSATDNVGVFLNATPAAGALTFTAPTAGATTLFTVGAAPSAIVASDLNVDGVPDLGLVNLSSGTATVRQSSGLSTNMFPAGRNTTLATGANPAGLAAGDLDLDTFPDLVTANRGLSTISVLPSTWGSTLFAVESEDVGSLPSSVVLGDFDLDGRLDAAVTNFSSNTVSILINNN